jgi:hypothetical protein
VTTFFTDSDYFTGPALDRDLVRQAEDQLAVPLTPQAAGFAYLPRMSRPIEGAGRRQLLRSAPRNQDATGPGPGNRTAPRTDPD